MIESGIDLRKFRTDQNVSQARFSEIVGLPQHRLSSFELGKIDLAPDELLKIRAVTKNFDDYTAVRNRRKRYVSHTYSTRRDTKDRAARHRLSPGNKEYLEELSALAKNTDAKYSAISLFSGIGGLSLGFKSAGFSIEDCIELDDDLHHIHRLNNPSMQRSASDINEVDIAQLVSRYGGGAVDVIVGGPPCQGFSLAGKRNKHDVRNMLFRRYIEVLRAVRPKVAIIENVGLLTSMKGPSGSFIKHQILEGLTNSGYKNEMFVVNAKNYGVPQHRERVFFVATRGDLRLDPSFPKVSHQAPSNSLFAEPSIRTFADACSDLPYIESGQTSDDVHHAAVNHPDHVLDWLWDVEEGRSAHENEDPNRRPPSGYNTTYKRQVWTEPAATVQTTFGMISGCRNVHPIATRSLTIREAARIQSFPDSYILEGSLGTIRTGLGNAVPPLLARRVAQHVRSMLTDLIEIPRL